MNGFAVSCLLSKKIDLRDFLRTAECREIVGRKSIVTVKVKISVNQSRVRMSANLIQSTHFSGSYVENQQGTVVKKLLRRKKPA